MSVKNTYSSKSDAKEAVLEISDGFKDFENKMILYFASSNYDLEGMGKEMKKAFPDSEIFGCSTAGEITSGEVLKNSVVAMSFDSGTVEDVKIEVVKKIKEENNVKKAFEGFESYYGGKMSEMDVEKYVGIILADGLTCAEEKLMDTIGDLTDVTFIGGSAGDDLKFKQTWVFADGKVYSDVAVLVLVKCKKGFDVIKSQSFKVTDKKLVATKVDEDNRKVLEFNDRPAVEAYAEVVGAKSDKAADHFMNHPVGLMVGGEPYVRSPQLIEDKSIKFYCKVKQGAELRLLASTDIVKDTKKSVKSKIDELGGVTAILNFHCILRTLELEKLKQTDAYGAIFKDIPTIGFSTYGEEYVGHINQTSTMLVFK